MRRCTACAVDVEGAWSRCPLCAAKLAGDPSPSPLPAAPLRFSRRRVLRALFAASLALILGSFAAQLFFRADPSGIGALRFVWLGIASMWLVVLMAVRQRRNPAKGTVSLVVLVGLVCSYWDYLTGWHAWSLTYAVPIVCASAIIALFITVQLMRIEAGEHVVYSVLAVTLGLVPIVFLVLGWVTHPLPSAICGVLSLMLLILELVRGAEMRHELAKRLNL
ncbi:DUF6320 domain-containing protein [Leucobacter ruminantium]|uniref:Zinc ribbon domain-containing protein n=1 Tax=Leucobacter ruminantium TaxID=1289170 RepID=A0A939LVQ8_9MICO|nr:DUF6320 domain-containing protein [Leucobacter ruminantium]MBO1805654.1 hypothetical protein [Leucobacter ruminantium]